MVVKRGIGSKAHDAGFTDVREVEPWEQVQLGPVRVTAAPAKHVVMTAEQAAELCGVLRPRVAVPIHYAFTAGPLRDRLLLKYDGTPERFQQAVARQAPNTRVRVLAPGEPLSF
jgi:L-ascorbate metabolism protein UlaG (beta-lactamase superfamily)